MNERWGSRLLGEPRCCDGAVAAGEPLLFGRRIRRASLPRVHVAPLAVCRHAAAATTTTTVAAAAAAVVVVVVHVAPLAG